MQYQLVIKFGKLNQCQPNINHRQCNQVNSHKEDTESMQGLVIRENTAQEPGTETVEHQPSHRLAIVEFSLG